MNRHEIHKGNELAPSETIVWQGGPALRELAFQVFHLRGIAAYFGLLFGVDAFQAWSKGEALRQALHDSVPLFVLCSMAFGILALIALFTARATRYTITNRRVILHYGIAMPATLSLPYERIVKVSITIGGRHTGDIPLSLAPGNHIGYLKLWPLARPWCLKHPEPMLRAVPSAAVVAGLLTRAIAASGSARIAPQPAADEAIASGERLAATVNA